MYKKVTKRLFIRISKKLAAMMLIIIIMINIKLFFPERTIVALRWCFFATEKGFRRICVWRHLLRQCNSRRNEKKTKGRAFVKIFYFVCLFVRLSRSENFACSLSLFLPRFIGMTLPKSFNVPYDLQKFFFFFSNAK